MVKPLVFSKTKIRTDEKEMDSWELLAFGTCPIMHAAWNPETQTLIVQFNMAKECLNDLPRRQKSGKLLMQETRLDQYYKAFITDKDAIQYVFDSFVGNYTDQDWRSFKVEEHDQEPEEFPEVVEHESILEKV